MLDYSVGDLRVLRAVAQRGSFTGAARELGYTQSAVSKRIAGLETALGRPLAVRERRGVRLTAAGEVLLRHAAAALEAMEDAERELAGGGERRERPVRLGAFGSAVAGVVPGALERLAGAAPGLEVTVREGTSAALVRALRAGTIDLALLAGVGNRPPDEREPPLELETLASGPLRIVVGSRHRLAGRAGVDVAELAGERWVVARAEGEEQLLGRWPAAAGRGEAPFVVRDWLAKLALVASGAAITTIPDVLLPALPPGVRAVSVTGGPAERRRLLLARMPGVVSPAAEAVAEALRLAARGG